MRRINPNLVKIGMKYDEVINILGKSNLGEKEIPEGSNELRECAFSYADGAWGCTLNFDEDECLNEISRYSIR
jgi:hypothetical protein